MEAALRWALIRPAYACSVSRIVLKCSRACAGVRQLAASNMWYACFAARKNSNSRCCAADEVPHASNTVVLCGVDVPAAVTLVHALSSSTFHLVDGSGIRCMCAVCAAAVLACGLLISFCRRFMHRFLGAAGSAGMRVHYHFLFI